MSHPTSRDLRWTSTDYTLNEIMSKFDTPLILKNSENNNKVLWVDQQLTTDALCARGRKDQYLMIPHKSDMLPKLQIYKDPKLKSLENALDKKRFPFRVTSKGQVNYLMKNGTEGRRPSDKLTIESQKRLTFLLACKLTLEPDAAKPELEALPISSWDKFYIAAGYKKTKYDWDQFKSTVKDRIEELMVFHPKTLQKVVFQFDANPFMANAVLQPTCIQFEIKESFDEEDSDVEPTQQAASMPFIPPPDYNDDTLVANQIETPVEIHPKTSEDSPDNVTQDHVFVPEVQGKTNREKDTPLQKKAIKKSASDVADGIFSGKRSSKIKKLSNSFKKTKDPDGNMGKKECKAIEKKSEWKILGLERAEKGKDEYEREQKKHDLLKQKENELHEKNKHDQEKNIKPTGTVLTFSEKINQKASAIGKTPHKSQDPVLPNYGRQVSEKSPRQTTSPRLSFSDEISGMASKLVSKHKDKAENMQMSNQSTRATPVIANIPPTTATPAVANIPVVAPASTTVVAPASTTVAAPASTTVVAPASTIVVAKTSTSVVAQASTTVVATTSTPVVATIPMVATKTTPMGATIPVAETTSTTLVATTTSTPVAATTPIATTSAVGPKKSPPVMSRWRNETPLQTTKRQSEQVPSARPVSAMISALNTGGGASVGKNPSQTKSQQDKKEAVNHQHISTTQPKVATPNYWAVIGKEHQAKPQQIIKPPISDQSMPRPKSAISTRNVSDGMESGKHSSQVPMIDQPIRISRPISAIVSTINSGGGVGLDHSVTKPQQATKSPDSNQPIATSRLDGCGGNNKTNAHQTLHIPASQYSRRSSNSSNNGMLLVKQEGKPPPPVKQRPKKVTVQEIPHNAGRRGSGVSPEIANIPQNAGRRGSGVSPMIADILQNAGRKGSGVSPEIANIPQNAGRKRSGVSPGIANLIGRLPARLMAPEDVGSSIPNRGEMAGKNPRETNEHLYEEIPCHQNFDVQKHMSTYSTNIYDRIPEDDVLPENYVEIQKEGSKKQPAYENTGVVAGKKGSAYDNTAVQGGDKENIYENAEIQGGDRGNVYENAAVLANLQIPTDPYEGHYINVQTYKFT